MDNPINYSALAAECEAKAKAGVGPELDWTDVYISRSSLIGPLESTIMVADVGDENTEYGLLDTDRSTDLNASGYTFSTIRGAQIFTEALLRDATRPLHREAYEAEQHVDDLCTALCHATDQRMSKPGYTVDAMMSEIDDVRQRAIDKATSELEDDLETATRIAHLVLTRSAADDPDGDELLDSYRKQIRAIVKSRGYLV